MRAFRTDHAPLVLPPGHRFPMEKYALLGAALLREGVLEEDQVAFPEEAERARIEAVHDPDYVRAFLAGTLDARAVKRLGFPWSPALVRRTLVSVGATLAAVEAALAEGCAGSLAGGTHHAHRAHGAGFCVFNDLAVAARWLLDAGRARRVLVFDVDVHQGDGTAALLADEPRAFTASLHGARNFPPEKAKSDLDVGLPDGTGDDEYLAALDGALDAAWERARPDFVLVQAGVDVLADDRLGRLGLSLAGCAERDRRVLRAAWERGVPVALTAGGGYGPRTVEGHVGTWRAARLVFG